MWRSAPLAGDHQRGNRKIFRNIWRDGDRNSISVCISPDSYPWVRWSVDIFELCILTYCSPIVRKISILDTNTKQYILHSSLTSLSPCSYLLSLVRPVVLPQSASHNNRVCPYSWGSVHASQVCLHARCLSMSSSILELSRAETYKSSRYRTASGPTSQPPSWYWQHSANY